MHRPFALRIAASIGAFLAAIALMVVNPVSAADSPSITIAGTQSTTVNVTLDDLRKLPIHKVQVVTEKGNKAEYEGVAVGAVLAQAGLGLGKTIRGKRLTEYLVVTARDDYRAIFALPELDPEFTDRMVLLCFTRDGAALPPEEGPLRIIIPNEKRPARWVRQVNGFAIKREM